VFAGNVSGRFFKSHVLCLRVALPLFISVSSKAFVIEGS